MAMVIGTRCTVEVKVDGRLHGYTGEQIGAGVTALWNASSKNRRVHQLRLDAQGIYVTVEIALDDNVTGDHMDRLRRTFTDAWMQGVKSATPENDDG